MQRSAKTTPPSDSGDFPGFFDTFESSTNRLTRQSDQSDMSEVSVSDAARLLGITERSVWRRIRQKKLNSRLKDGRTIVSISQPVMSVTHTDASADISIDVTDVDDCQTDTSDKALHLIAELAAKLEGATYRNGFLEAQLSTAREQMKLIPDLQARASELEGLQNEVARLNAQLELQKRTQWNRFISWLKGDR